MKKIKRERSLAQIPTSSLPDIIFILLFFFMMVTVLRKNDILVTQNFPRAKELKKVDNNQLTTEIYIGLPLNASMAHNRKSSSTDRSPR